MRWSSFPILVDGVLVPVVRCASRETAFPHSYLTIQDTSQEKDAFCSMQFNFHVFDNDPGTI